VLLQGQYEFVVWLITVVCSVIHRKLEKVLSLKSEDTDNHHDFYFSLCELDW